MRYIIGILLIVVGFGGGLYFSIASILDQTTNMQRFEVPGTSTLELKAGDYTIYYESRSILNGVAYRGTQEPVSVECNVVGAKDAGVIKFEAAKLHSTYSIGSYEGESLFSLAIPKDGPYEFTCSFTKPGPSAVLALSSPSWSFVAGLLIGILCLFAGVAVLVMAIVKTSRSRSRQ